MKRVFGAETKIMDAKIAMKLLILPQHTAKGKKDSAVCCGIAQALGGKDVAVLRTTTYVKEGNVVRKYKNGEDAMAYIKLFDHGGLKMTQPMQITLLPVPPSHTRAAYLKRRAALKKRIASGKPPRAYAKPTMAKGSKVRIYQPTTHRTVLVDGKNRCAVRYQTL
jgi:hypothetical protein